MENPPRIYVDACCFITLAENQTGNLPDFQDTSNEAEYRNDQNEQSWFLKKALEAARNEEIEVFTSFLTMAEATTVGNHKHKVPENAKRFLDMTLRSGRSGVKLTPMTISISEQARNLRWLHELNLAGADAIHVATALAFDCSEFWSGERRGMRKQTHRDKLSELGLTVCKPQESTKIPQSYLQLDLELADE